MEIYRLQAQDYPELISLLNAVFTRKNGRAEDFEANLPKMCVADEVHMGHHLGIRQDGKLCAVLGIYPIPCTVAGTPLLFSTVGNVATHWDYEGKGYMGILMQQAMKELDRIGADASRLGGARQRYNRFGYETCGTVYDFTLTPHNVLRCFADHPANLSFAKIEKTDLSSLAYTLSLYQKNAIVADRTQMPNYFDVYASLTAWQNQPYLALRPDQTPCGYLCVNAAGDGIAEWGAESIEDAVSLFVAWQKRTGKPLSFRCAPDQRQAIQRFSAVCEQMRFSPPCHFQMRSWEKLIWAFLRLKSSYTHLPNGTLRLHILDYGTLQITVEDGVPSCEKTKESAHLTMDRLTATRFLFGPLPPSVVAPSHPLADAWFPLPLSWNLQDRV